MRGRKPKPTARQIAEGDPRKRGKRKLDEALDLEPKAARGLPDCPRHLKGRARAAWNFWREELEAMKLDSRPDAMMLQAACIAYADAMEAHLQIERLGAVVEEPIQLKETGEIVGFKLKKNPWVEVKNRALMLMGRFCTEFGLSPVSRTRLKVEKDDEAGEDLIALLSKPREPRKSPSPDVPSDVIQ